MTPYLTAKALHESDPENVPWDDLISAHLVHGVLVSTPDVFLAMRPIDCWSSFDAFNDPWSESDAPAWMGTKSPNCWHVYLAAGDLGGLFDFCPYELPLVSFVRKNTLRFQNFHRLKAKLQSHGRKSQETTGGGANAGERDRGGEPSPTGCG
jgi:hypothetical protein